MEKNTKKHDKRKIKEAIKKKEIILTSSTANSTKKFKITVDDIGTLTATEITQ